MEGIEEGTGGLSSGDSLGEEIHELSVVGVEFGLSSEGIPELFKSMGVSLAAGDRVEGGAQVDSVKAVEDLYWDLMVGARVGGAWALSGSLGLV